MGNTIVNGTNCPEELWGRRKVTDCHTVAFAFLSHTDTAFGSFLFLVLVVVLVVFCCLCFKRSIFFSLHLTSRCFNAHQRHPTTSRKNKNHKTPQPSARTPYAITCFQLLKKKKRKNNACLIFSHQCFKISHLYPTFLSLSSHIFPLLVVSMMVQIIFS